MSDNEDGRDSNRGDGNRGSSTIDRRTALKGLGTVGGIAAIGGMGLSSFAGGAAAASVNITANAPQTISNDRGDVSRVTINPTFSVDWSNFDQAVGKVFYLVEAKVGSGNYWPVFRSTPFLTPGSLQGVGATKPGTTGSFQLTAPVGVIMNRAVQARSDPQRVGTPQWPNLPLPRALTVADERGRPDYLGFGYSQSSAVTGDPATSFDGYINGNSIGGTPNAMIESVTNPAQNKDEDPFVLVNHFPGARSGLYGAASGTDALDVASDGDSNATTVSLRYTFAFYSINQSSVQFFTQNDFSSYADTGEAVQNDPHLSNVRESDIEQDGSGNSVLVMNGEDGYPDITNNGANSPASVRYGALQKIAGSHPAAITTTAAFNVHVANQQSDAGVTGNSNTGASGGGQ